jgi:hypothetical protein
LATTLSPTARGDFTFGDNFMDVMLPYVTSHFEKSHMAEVQRYGDIFVPPPQDSKTQEEVFGNDFVESFHEEFGISPGRLAELGMVLLGDAIKQSGSMKTFHNDVSETILTEAGSIRDPSVAKFYERSSHEREPPA